MDRKKTYVALIGVFILLLAVVGLTYAYWQITLTQEDENLVYTDCLEITFTDKNPIRITNAYPMNTKELEEEFFPTATPYHFTVENVCDNETDLTINVETLNVTDTKLNDKWVDVILWEGTETDHFDTEKTILSKTNTEGSVDPTLGEYPLTIHTDNTANKIIQDSLKAYALYSFTLPRKGKKEFNVLMFMDEETPVSTPQEVTNNANWESKITLSGMIKELPMAEKTLADLTTHDYDSGETGMYEIDHTSATIAYTSDQTYITRFQQKESRFAGDEPDNYIDVGDRVQKNTYGLYVTTTNTYASQESCDQELQKAKAKVGYTVTEESTCTSTENSESKWVVEYTEDSGEKVSQVFDSQESCTSTSAERQKTQECTQPENLYTFTYEKLDVETDFNSTEECEAQKQSAENKECKIKKTESIPVYWRIIGLVNTQEGQRIKIIRDEPLDASQAWDTSDEEVNQGHGVNEWNGSDIQVYLNETYLQSLPQTFQANIDNVTWNTGTNATEETEINLGKFYENERSKNIPSCVKDEVACSDETARTFTWKGKVGLMSVSDYGYATSGVLEENNKTACESANGSAWSTNQCATTDWLHDTEAQFTMNAYNDASSKSKVLRITAEGGIEAVEANTTENKVRPVVYLKKGLFFASGDGKTDSPYVVD